LFVGIIRDLARKHGLAKFRVGYFYSEVSKDALRRRIAAGYEIPGLDGRPRLDLATLDATERIVAMAGIHPYIKLLDEGVDVIVGGRSSDLRATSLRFLRLSPGTPTCRAAIPGLCRLASLRIARVRLVGTLDAGRQLVDIAWLVGGCV
jgi:hypothetical protein